MVLRSTRAYDALEKRNPGCLECSENIIIEKKMFIGKLANSS